MSDWTQGLLAAWLLPYRADCRRDLAEIKLERPTVPASLPLSVARPESAQHPAEAISGPHGHGLTLWGRLVWRWRVMRAERMRPRGVAR